MHRQTAIFELATAELECAGHAAQVTESDAAKVTEYVSTPQSVHARLPLLVLYLPGTHAEHRPPSAPV